VPAEFYVFTNLLNPITKNNLEVTKGFTSGTIGDVIARPEVAEKYMGGTLDYLPFAPNDNPDLYTISVYALNATSNYRIEYNCELYRKQHDATKLYPSRLSCLYAFGDWATCETVAEKYSWPLKEVRKFTLLNLPYTRVAKVNMEVVSLMRDLEPIATWPPEEQEIIWQHYWSGQGDLTLEAHGTVHHSDVMWEYLIEGRVALVENRRL